MGQIRVARPWNKADGRQRNAEGLAATRKRCEVFYQSRRVLRRKM